MIDIIRTFTLTITITRLCIQLILQRYTKAVCHADNKILFLGGRKSIKWN